jgi:hypothetical protein
MIQAQGANPLKLFGDVNKKICFIGCFIIVHYYARCSEMV